KLDQLSKTDIKLLIPEMEPEYIHINTSMSEKEDVLAKMFDIVEAFEVRVISLVFYSSLHISCFNVFFVFLTVLKSKVWDDKE
ncbi:hypothetical protein Bpfe_005526, partial [Biomphalaria pfeifferi]